MNPPSVYELTNPSSHSTSRITNIVQSIGLFLSVKHTYLRTSHFRCAYTKRKFLRFLQRGAQIRACRVQIDHEIAAHFPQSDHRAGADDVERYLRCGTGFQSRGPSQDFWSDRKRD